MKESQFLENKTKGEIETTNESINAFKTAVGDIVPEQVILYPVKKKRGRPFKLGGFRENSGRLSGDEAVSLNKTMSMSGGNSREVLKFQKKSAYQNITMLEKKLMSIIKTAQGCIQMDKITARDIQSLYVALGIAQTKKSELETGIKEDDAQGVMDNEDLDGRQKQLVDEIVMTIKRKHTKITLQEE